MQVAQSKSTTQFHGNCHNLIYFYHFPKFRTFQNVLNIFVSVELIPRFVSRLLAGRKWKEIEFNDSLTAVFLSISGELPNLRIPFHTVFKLTPIAYGKYVTHGGFVCPAWCKERNARKRSTTAFPQNPAVLFSWGWLLFLGLKNFDMTQLVDNLWYHGWPIAPYFWVEISAL